MALLAANAIHSGLIFQMKQKLGTRRTTKRLIKYRKHPGKKCFGFARHGHEWLAQVASRRKTGCPYCAGQKVSETNNFFAKFPEKALYWDFSKNAQAPEEVVSQTINGFGSNVRMGIHLTLN